MNTKQIKYNSPEYSSSLKIRSDVLRVPLGKVLTPLDTADEERQLHFGYFKDFHLIACVIIKPDEKGINAQLRQMAVDTNFQGQGIGKRILMDVEVYLKLAGYKSVQLSARKTAQVFYEKRRYYAVGEIYFEQGIEHIKMQKLI